MKAKILLFSLAVVVVEMGMAQTSPNPNSAGALTAQTQQDKQAFVYLSAVKTLHTSMEWKEIWSYDYSLFGDTVETADATFQNALLAAARRAAGQLCDDGQRI